MCLTIGNYCGNTPLKRQWLLLYSVTGSITKASSDKTRSKLKWKIQLLVDRKLDVNNRESSIVNNRFRYQQLTCTLWKYYRNDLSECSGEEIPTRNVNLTIA